jgi:hypothetical protein
MNQLMNTTLEVEQVEEPQSFVVQPDGPEILLFFLHIPFMFLLPPRRCRYDGARRP